jgi:hypothetical protein
MKNTPLIKEISTGVDNISSLFYDKFGKKLDTIVDKNVLDNSIKNKDDKKKTKIENLVDKGIKRG